jgi:23S rRNA (adenine2503-C2)-methyltransferase
MPVFPEASTRSLRDLTFAETEEMLETAGLKRFHAQALWHALYRTGASVAESARDFAPPLRRWFQEQGDGILETAPECVLDTESSDGFTRKFLLELADRQTVETVLMGYAGRLTACLSTQAGCAMGCVFCATGQMGFVRHLRPAEIVAQVLHARRAHGVWDPNASGGLRNLVLMGMGEPLHNYDAVMQALAIITDTHGLNIGASRITISTVGVVPEIRRLADQGQPYNLAVSLHAATQEARAALVPTARRWPLDELMAACRYYTEKTGRRIFFEWTLIAGENDTADQARAVAESLRGIDAHLNLIPLNPTQQFHGEPTTSLAVTAFQKLIQAAGIPCTVRQRRGIDVAAGCGQLRAEKLARSL